MKVIGMLAFLCVQYCAMAQRPDTLSITLEQAEHQFLQKNLLLLAQRYEIDAAKASELQERLFDNPVFSSEWATYGSNGKWFDIGRQGQKVIAIEQLIQLAGKRNKRVLLAKAQTEVAELRLYDLLRTLRFELRQQFYTLAYASELQQQYDEQLRLLDQIIRAYEDQAEKRNVSLKDAIRLKSERIQLLAVRAGIAEQAIDANRALQVLLDTSASISPVKLQRDAPVQWPALQQLINTARANRIDIRLQQNEIRQKQLDLGLQKAMAVPDLTVGASYDQQGSYTNHLYSLRAAIDLPFFNRNQGNIRAARSRLQSAQLVQDFLQSSLEKEVSAALEQASMTEVAYQQSVHTFNTDFPAVNRAVIENFNKGNITILEFLDFFENYNEAIRQMNELHKQRQLSFEALEFAVGGIISL